MQTDQGEHEPGEYVFERSGDRLRRPGERALRLGPLRRPTAARPWEPDFLARRGSLF